MVKIHKSPDGSFLWRPQVNSVISIITSLQWDCLVYEICGAHLQNGSSSQKHKK